MVESAGVEKSPIHQDDNGWWFYDETWSYRYGPFPTRRIAALELHRYIIEMLGE